MPPDPATPTTPAPEPGPPPAPAAAAGSRSPSLAYRLAVTHAVSLIILCALIAFVVDNAVVRGLERDLELVMESEARQAERVIASEREPVEPLRDHLRHLLEAKTRPHIAMRAVGPDGAVVVVDPVAAADGPPGDPDDWDRTQESAQDGAGREWTLHVVGSRREIDRFLYRFRRNLVAVVTPLLAFGIVLAYFLVKRMLAPLDTVSAAAARIGSRTLGARLEVAAAPGEIGRLVSSFNAMLDRLEDAFHRLEDFGADLAHEMRTPVQNLRGEAEVALLNPRTAGEYREVLARIVDECGLLARLVDDVLLLSRVERQEEALDLAEFDLAAEIEDVGGFFENVAASRGIEFAVSLARPLVVRGDRLKLRRAIANLVDNALKYTDRGGRVRVEARLDGTGGEPAAEVRVTDTGKGIPPGDLPKVFQRFYRVEKSRSREYGGAGLGLGIARTLVKAHGGELTIDSVEGTGTTAVVRLPATSASAAALRG